MKKHMASVLFLLLLAIGTTVVAPTTVATVVTASTSEEEEDNGEEESEPTEPVFPFTTTQPESPAPAPVIPVPVPAGESPSVADLIQVPIPTGEPPSVADLIQKYGANQSEITLTPSMLSEIGQKAVVLTFDDNWESQYSYAEPILRNNGFNATFFIYCLGIEQGPEFMTAAQLRDLHAKGYDIQSHSMTHADLSNASQAELDFEIATSKQCIEELVPNSQISIYATPYAIGTDNATILEAIRDGGFEFGRVGYGGSFYLGCDGWYVPDNQTAGCALYEDNGTLKIQNRYNIPVSDVNGIGRDVNHDLNATQETFIREVNNALSYDAEGKINALPVLVYHNFTNRVLPPEQMGESLLSESFAQQMQYLRDNEFIVLSLKDLVFDETNQTFSIPKLG